MNSGVVQGTPDLIGSHVKSGRVVFTLEFGAEQDDAPPVVVSAVAMRAVGASSALKSDLQVSFALSKTISRLRRGGTVRLKGKTVCR